MKILKKFRTSTKAKISLLYYYIRLKRIIRTLNILKRLFFIKELHFYFVKYRVHLPYD